MAEVGQAVPSRSGGAGRSEVAKTPWIASREYASPVELGQRVRAARERLRLSLRDVQIRTGVSTMTVSRMENGQGSGMALGAFLRLCEALEMPAGELLRVSNPD
jgi:DNA-binding Xre family transcriptional regulator